MASRTSITSITRSSSHCHWSLQHSPPWQKDLVCLVPTISIPSIVSQTQVRRRTLHQNYGPKGVNLNPNRPPAAESRLRLISRLDRILNSQHAQTTLSLSQLSHIQYLRDWWADQPDLTSDNPKKLRRLNAITTETHEVLMLHSAAVGRADSPSSPPHSSELNKTVSIPTQSQSPPVTNPPQKTTNTTVTPTPQQPRNIRKTNQLPQGPRSKSKEQQ